MRLTFPRNFKKARFPKLAKLPTALYGKNSAQVQMLAFLISSCLKEEM
jgi:hypothetical protein